MTATTSTSTSAIGSPAASGVNRPRWGRMWRLAEVRWASAATVLFVAGLLVQFAGGPAWAFWALYLACYAAGGREPACAGVQALREKSLDVDLLMIVAAIGAAAIGQVLDGALLIVIFATSGALEAIATQRTEDAVSDLLDLAPEQATVLTDAGEQRVDTSSLQVGQVVLVRPGERIGADGEVVDGSSDVDQASITGEPLPVSKTLGDEVFAGTVNGTGTLTLRVERDPADTVIARIVALVREASATKATTQLFIEKVEQRYSIGVVVATLALFFLPLAFGADFQGTLLRAMTFMIVASPCAVVLATMPPLLSAIASAGRHGVLVKSAVVMEQLGQTSLVAFDKTGTLTEGTPRLTTLEILPGSPVAEDELLRLAASAERPSEHPLGRAIVTAARERDLPLAHSGDFRALPGLGVTATVNGHRIEITSPQHRPDSAGNHGTKDDGPAGAAVAVLERGGQTAVIVTVDGEVAGVLGLADRLRTGAAATTAALTTLTGAGPVLLTGDNPTAAAHLAGQVAITDVRAGLLPHDKVTAVKDLESRGHRVLVVGDGVNDAPALAAAHTGVAMGRAGADLTLHTADAVIVRDELATLPAVIALSRRAKRVVAANLVIAAAFITALVIWDLTGHLPLPLGVAGHEGSTIIVGLNGLRLLRKNAWRAPTR